MRETELTEIGRELAKYFTARPGDDTWDGFGLEYSMRDMNVTHHASDRPRLVQMPSIANVRYIADYVAVIEDPSPLPPAA